MNNTVRQLGKLLDLTNEPVAIAFRDKAPEDMSKADSAAPSGCTFWKRAAAGQSFYTEAADHFGCPIGAYTHGVEMPDEKMKELQGLIGTMVQLQYIDMNDVPSIPRRQQPFGVALYAPLASASFEPDVVIVSGDAKQMMLLAEAAHAAGISTESSMVGRPTCAAIPAVMQSQRATANLGCIGNRVYTEMPDDQLYFSVSAASLTKIVEKLQSIVAANRELEKFHRARL